VAAQRRGRGDGTLYKRADGLWVGGVEMPVGPDGTRRQKRVTAKSRNAAVDKLRKLKAAVAAGQVPTAPSTTVERWLNYWVSDILPHRNIKPATVYGYEAAVRNHLIPNLGAKRLDRLQPSDIRALYTKLAERGTTRTAQKVDQVLRLTMKAALREGIIGVNVMDKIDKPLHTKAEGVAFDSATAMRIIATAVAVQGPMWGARWAAGFLTGGRESEILGLEWSRVDFTRGLVDISWQLNRQQREHGCGKQVDGKWPCGRVRPGWCPDSKWRFKGDMRPCEGTLAWTRPKTRAGMRVIPLVPALADILRQIRDDEPNPHGLVFHLPDGKPFTQELDQDAWKQLLIAAEIPHAPQHSIRHSTATLLMEAGVDAHVIQSVIGHSDLAMTRAYQHVNLDMARAAWGNLAALLPSVT
jgi:integrase